MNLLNESVSTNQEFDTATITLRGNEIVGKPFDEVEKALGVELGKPDYRTNMVTDAVTVKLSFSSNAHSGGLPQFTLGSFSVRYEL